MNWTPGTLLEMSGYYWKTCTLHAGVNLDIFTLLGTDALSGETLAKSLTLAAVPAPLPSTFALKTRILLPLSAIFPPPGPLL